MFVFCFDFNGIYKLYKRESTKQFHNSYDQVTIGLQEGSTTNQEAQDHIQGF